MLAMTTQTASVDNYRDSQPTSTLFDIEEGDDFVGWIRNEGDYCTFISQYIRFNHILFVEAGSLGGS
jgi:hypothetical protein